MIAFSDFFYLCVLEQYQVTEFPFTFQISSIFIFVENFTKQDKSNVEPLKVSQILEHP